MKLVSLATSGLCNITIYSPLPLPLPYTDILSFGCILISIHTDKTPVNLNVLTSTVLSPAQALNTGCLMNGWIALIFSASELLHEINMFLQHRELKINTNIGILSKWRGKLLAKLSNKLFGFSIRTVISDSLLWQQNSTFRTSG